MNITIHRGTNQIGGCVTEYEYSGWRLFVDYGEQLPGAPTVDRTLEIEGLTKGDLSKSALLITHYHGDHIGKLSEVAAVIPVFMGYTGIEIYRKLQRRLSYIMGEDGEKARKSYERSGTIHTFMEDEEFQFGPFTVKPIKMDHSAYDSYGFVISITYNCEDAALHTGDFRAHGVYGELFWNTVSSIPDVKVIVCEATNIERISNEAEPEWKIERRFEQLFKDNKYNYVFVSSTNIDRLFGMYRAARAADRVVLMDEYQYDVLNSVVGKNDWMRNEEIGVNFIEDDGTTSFDTLDPSYEFDKGLPFALRLDRTEKDSPRFYVPYKLRRLINWKGCVLFARTTPQFEAFIESFPAQKSMKYLSMWKGYVNPDFPAYNESLAKVLGEEYEYVHTSGHADTETLKTLFSHVRYDVIIPMHTDNPKKFMEVFGESEYSIRLLKDGEILETGTL